jgi:hypothetical protein
MIKLIQKRNGSPDAQQGSDRAEPPYHPISLRRIIPRSVRDHVVSTSVRIGRLTPGAFRMNVKMDGERRSNADMIMA